MLLAVCAALPSPASAWSAETHQTLTFLAARQFNRCVDGASVPRLAPLEVRYVARRDVDRAERGIFNRMVNWHYYDREHRTDRLLGVIEPRMHEDFAEHAAALAAADSLSERYSALGVLVWHLQRATLPVVVVPIWTGRFWRLSLSDRLAAFEVDETRLEAAGDELCAALAAEPADGFEDLLTRTAEATRGAIRAPIPGMPQTWEVFWREPDADDGGGFGEYGEVGNNFGRDVEFDCGEAPCNLLARDPIYDDFAFARHLDAVRVTMQAMWMTQRALAAPAGPADQES